MSATANPMSQLRITKVCVNIGVGEGGERLVNAENVLEMVTASSPSEPSVAFRTATSRSVSAHPLAAKPPCATKKPSRPS